MEGIRGMAKTGKRRAKTASRKTAKKSKGTGKAKGRVSFTKVWEKLGDRVLKGGIKDRGWERKALVSTLATDLGLQQLLVERIVRLLPGAPPGATTAGAAAPAAVAEASNPSSHADEAADEYACAMRATTHRREAGEAEGASGEPSDWRIF